MIGNSLIRSISAVFLLLAFSAHLNAEFYPHPFPFPGPGPHRKPEPKHHYHHRHESLESLAARIILNGILYYYHEGTFYCRRPEGLIMVQAPQGAMINALPKGYTRVIVNGQNFYRYGNTWFAYADSRFLVVADPRPEALAIAADPGQGSEVIMVYVPNKNGSYMRIELQRVPEGYVGPKNELYPEFPTVDQLTQMYGQ
ncbi:MAG: DUF6515 family protein [Candidatus Wallbacteria bacterium]|nr:DUF6515 family protein [Candidatus Wallbacteria bacterium]